MNNKNKINSKTKENDKTNTFATVKKKIKTVPREYPLSAAEKNLPKAWKETHERTCNEGNRIEKHEQKEEKQFPRVSLALKTETSVMTRWSENS